MNQASLQPPRRQRGVVMVLVLWLIILLFVVASSLSYEMHLGGRMTSFSKKKLRALGLARAGVAQAVVDLKNDRLMAAADPLYNNDTPVDIWADIEEKTDIELGGGTYTYRVFDDDAKLDINAINPANRLALTYLLQEISGMDDDEARDVSNALLDYMDSDSTVVDAPDQDEQAYYTEWMLKHESEEMPATIFAPKNEALLSIDELMNVPGFTWRVLYGDPEARRRDPLVPLEEGERSEALVDYMTARTSGQVNVNTASLPVLEAMIYAASGGNVEPESIANAIDKFRMDLMKLSKGSGRGIMDPGQLQQSGIDPAILQNMTAMFRLTQQSHFFTIYSRGDFEGIRKTLRMRVYLEVHGYPLDPDQYGRERKRDDKAYGFLRSNPNFKIDPEVRVDMVSEL